MRWCEVVGGYFLFFGVLGRVMFLSVRVVIF